MIRKGMTIREAAKMWVSQFDAIPMGVIEKLQAAGDEICEVTPPALYDRVELYRTGDRGELVKHLEGNEWEVDLDNGGEVVVSEDDFWVLNEGGLPMWGTMWAFSDSCDRYRIEDREWCSKMADCGFRIYEQEDYGYIFGIDGAGYNFYEAHWIPLYRAWGFQWHDPEMEEEMK